MIRVVDVLTGALTLGFVVAGVFFYRFWRRTLDRLFLSFGLAFWLLAVNQLVIEVLGEADERVGQAYMLRILAFLLILAAIVRKNVAHRIGR